MVAVEPFDEPKASAFDMAAIDAARAEGVKLGASEMQARCKAILSSEQAKGREDLAAHLAFENDMSADAATALLGKAPKATAGGGNRFDEAMKRAGNPVIGPDDARGSADPDDIEGIMASAGYARRERR